MIHFCPISYEPLEKNERYHQKGLNQLSYHLKSLNALSFSAKELRIEAMNRASKMSIQGVQPKLSARLNSTQSCFDIVDSNGTFILKPESDTWPELPANEALTMTLAKYFGLIVPLHGLLFDRDENPVYFIKRFDRFGKTQKYAVEDFAQLSNQTRETKYNSSCERVVKIINQFTTFPAEQRIELMRRLIFCFCTGNEDMHLKNFSLIQKDDKSMISPVYDFLNTTIALKNPIEEMALPLHGKKNKINHLDIFIYFGKEILKISDTILYKIQSDILKIIDGCDYFLPRSYLTKEMKEAYRDLIQKRTSILMQPF